MRRSYVACFCFAGGLATSLAQAIPQSELLNRLQANSNRYAELEQPGVDLQKVADDQGTDIVRELDMQINQAQCTPTDSTCPLKDDSNHWRIKQAVQNSDLIVIGTVLQQLGALTHGRSFVFTDTEISVGEVWMSRIKDPHAVRGGEITVSTAGGSVRLNGHLITVTVNVLTPFKIGDRYLLFLKYIPQSHSYELVSPLGFDLSGQAIVPLAPTLLDAPGSQYFQNQSNFLRAMQSSMKHALEEVR